MAIAALTIHSQREEVVDFTVPFYDEAATVVIKVTWNCDLRLQSANESIIVKQRCDVMV